MKISTLTIFVFLSYGSLQAGELHKLIKDSADTTKAIAAAIQHNPKFLEERDEWGRTALHRAVLEDRPNILNFLLEQGVPVDVKDSAENTPLHVAAGFSGRPACAEILLKRRALVDALDNTGSTPLFHAYTFGNEKVAEMLLQNSASPDIKNKFGQTPGQAKEVYEKFEKQLEELYPNCPCDFQR